MSSTRAGRVPGSSRPARGARQEGSCAVTPSREHEDGSGLVETVTASVILAAVIASLAVGAIAGRSALHRADDRVTAALVAASEVELLVPDARTLRPGIDGTRLLEGRRRAGGRTWSVTVDAHDVTVPLNVRVGSEPDVASMEVRMIELVAHVTSAGDVPRDPIDIMVTRLVATDPTVTPARGQFAEDGA